MIANSQKPILNLWRDAGEFVQAYIEAALWSSTGDDGEPLDKNYGWTDLAPETIDGMIADCRKFESENSELIGARLKRAGHDFWLTRNHHGAGFWDGDWDEPADTKLTNAAHFFGECNLYIGDDGKIYV